MWAKAVGRVLPKLQRTSCFAIRLKQAQQWALPLVCVSETKACVSLEILVFNKIETDGFVTALHHCFLP